MNKEKLNLNKNQETMFEIHIDIDDVKIEKMRSSGPGGQKVNKTESAVRLRFDIAQSDKFTDIQKALLLHCLKSRLTKNGELLVRAEDSRSQRKNIQEALNKLNEIINKALIPKKKRTPTKPTYASRQKRMQDKKYQKIKKETRKKPEY